MSTTHTTVGRLNRRVKRKFSLLEFRSLFLCTYGFDDGPVHNIVDEPISDNSSLSTGGFNPPERISSAPSSTGSSSGDVSRDARIARAIRLANMASLDRESFRQSNS